MIGWLRNRRRAIAEAKEKLEHSQVQAQQAMFNEQGRMSDGDEPPSIPLTLNRSADEAEVSLYPDSPINAEKGIRKLFRKKGSSTSNPDLDRGQETGFSAGTDDLGEEFSVPTMVVIDFYQGLVKYNEAEQLARAFIEQHFSSPNACYYYLMRWREGMAIEMQQGGGRAFLPEVLGRIDQDPTAVVAVPASNRIAQIMLNGETGALETLLLPAQQGAPEGAHRALPGPAMKPFDRRGARLAVAGLAMATVSGIATLFSIASLFLDTDSWAAPYLSQAPVDSLPVSSQAHEAMQSALKTGDCVYKLEFNGSWKAVPGWESNGTCVSVKPPTAVSADLPAPTDGADGSLPVPPTATPLPAVVPPPPGVMQSAPAPKEAM